MTPGGGASRAPAVLALVGLRGAGKSSVGRALAHLAGRPFVDLDQRLAELAAGEGPPRAAGELLSELGEARFRELESAALRDVLGGIASEGAASEGAAPEEAAPRCDPPLVLATGGGVVLAPENRALLAERCRCVWLDAPAEVLLERIARGGSTRPALTELEPLEELRQQLRERGEHYARLAELRLDSSKEPIVSLARVILARTSD